MCSPELPILTRSWVEVTWLVLVNGQGVEVRCHFRVVNSFLLIAFTPKEQPYIWCLPGGAVSRWWRVAKMGERSQLKLDFQSKSVFIGLSQPQFWVLPLLQHSLTYPDVVFKILTIIPYLLLASILGSIYALWRIDRNIPENTEENMKLLISYS